MALLSAAEESGGVGVGGEADPRRRWGAVMRCDTCDPLNEYYVLRERAGRTRKRAKLPRLFYVVAAAQMLLLVVATLSVSSGFCGGGAALGPGGLQSGGGRMRSRGNARPLRAEGGSAAAGLYGGNNKVHVLPSQHNVFIEAGADHTRQSLLPHQHDGETRPPGKLPGQPPAPPLVPRRRRSNSNERARQSLPSFTFLSAMRQRITRFNGPDNRALLV